MEAKSIDPSIIYTDSQDSAIDNDIRIAVFDKWLLSDGFSYCGTAVSQNGGKRIYRKSVLDVTLFRMPNMETAWNIERTKNKKEVAHGSTLPQLILKIKRNI